MKLAVTSVAHHIDYMNFATVCAQSYELKQLMILLINNRFNVTNTGDITYLGVSGQTSGRLFL